MAFEVGRHATKTRPTIPNMIRLMVSYPRSAETHFDADYWLTTHMPLVSSNWSQVVRWEADVCADDADYYGVAHLYFDTHETMGAAMSGPNAAVVLGDIVNYTDSQPAMLVNTVAATSS
jgi:uncharacterized protein (TIGR02118 family)